MSKTHFSCDTVDRELCLVRCCALKCTGTLASPGKQGFVFILTDFKSDVFIPEINQCVNSYFKTEKS